MTAILDQLRALGLAALLLLAILAAGPVLAWAAQNQLGPTIVAVALAATAPRPPAGLLAAPARALPPWLSDRELLAVLLARGV